MLLKIGTVDFTSYVAHEGLVISYPILLSPQSGRNARGDNTFDVVNKKMKVEVTFTPLTDAKMATLLTAIDSGNFNITILDPKTNAEKTINIYTGDPSVSPYAPGLFKGFTMSFIEM